MNIWSPINCGLVVDVLILGAIPANRKSSHKAGGDKHASRTLGTNRDFLDRDRGFYRDNQSGNRASHRRSKKVISRTA